MGLVQDEASELKKSLGSGVDQTIDKEITFFKTDGHLANNPLKLAMNKLSDFDNSKSRS